MAQKDEKFYEEFAKEFNDEGLYWQKTQQPGGYLFPLRSDYLLHLISEHVKTGESILDVGCGDGIYLSKIQKQVQKVGIDISKTHIDRAEKKVPDGEFYLKDAEDPLPFPDEVFDLVYSTEVIEDVTNPIFFANELLRVTKRNGIVIITTPSKFGFRPGSLNWRWNVMVYVNKFCDSFLYYLKQAITKKRKRDRRIEKYTDHHHLHLFSLRSLAGLIPRDRIKEIKAVTCGLYLPCMPLWSRFIYRFSVFEKIYKSFDLFIGKIPFLKEINHTLIIIYHKK